ncbi:hypothetical protein GCM10017711_08410 [Paeniglutamicibacter sulfureus]
MPFTFEILDIQLEPGLSCQNRNPDFWHCSLGSEGVGAFTNRLDEASTFERKGVYQEVRRTSHVINPTQRQLSILLVSRLRQWDSCVASANAVAASRGSRPSRGKPGMASTGLKGFQRGLRWHLGQL